MGKSVRSHTVRFHNRIKKEKLQKLENRRLEAIAARAEENLAKYNMALAATENTMPSLSPMDVAAVKILVEEDSASSSNVMDLVENIGEIPTSSSTSMKQKKRAAVQRGRK